MQAGLGIARRKGRVVVAGAGAERSSTDAAGQTCAPVLVPARSGCSPGCVKWRTVGGSPARSTRSNATSGSSVGRYDSPDEFRQDDGMTLSTDGAAASMPQEISSESDGSSASDDGLDLS